MSTESDVRKESPRNKEFWLLILAGLFLFHRPLFSGDTFYFRDLNLHFYPQKLRFIEFVKSGQFPLWDAYLHGGQPYLGDLNNMAIYPTNLLYLILPPLFTFNLDIVFHILLCAMAAYWLARRLGFTPAAALIAGAIYGFSGYTLSLANLLNRLAAMPYLPLMLVSFLRYTEQRKFRWFVCSVVFGVFQILAGAPEMTLLTWITIFVFAWTKGGFSYLRISAGMFVFVIGLSAIQILPAVEMIQQSSRAGGTGYAAFSAWSLHPKRLPELIIPGFLGPTDTITRQRYWGSSLESLFFPFILSIYLGIITIILALIGFRQHRWSKLLGALALLGLIGSIGGYLPGFEAFFRHFHAFAFARYPIKIMAIAMLPLSLLAAAGVDHMFHAEQKTIRRITLSLWSISGLIVWMNLLLILSPAFCKWFVGFFFSSSSETAFQGVKLSFTHAAIVSVAAACIYHHWILKKGQSNQLALSVVILIDLVWAGFSVNHYAPAEFFKDEPHLIAPVKANVDGGRLYRSLNPRQMTLRLPSDDWFFFYRWNFETLQGYTAALFSIPVIYHEDFDVLAKREILKTTLFLALAPWEKRVPFLTAGGVSLIITADVVKVPDLQLLARVKNTSDSLFFLYRNKQISDLAFSVPEVINISSPKDAFKRLSEGGFDSRKQMFVEEAPLQKQSCNGAQLKRVQMLANVWRYTTSSPCDNFVYFAQPYDKGWITEVDGRTVPSYKANFAFTASPVPKGNHTLERFYRPFSFRLGLLITCVSTLLLILFGLFMCKKGDVGRREMRRLL